MVPGRLHGAFVALVDAGLDLTIDPSITTAQNGLGPSILLLIIKTTISKLATLLVLGANDFIDVKESDDDQNGTFDLSAVWLALSTRTPARVARLVLASEHTRPAH